MSSADFDTKGTFSDVVLPATTPLERNDVGGGPRPGSSRRRRSGSRCSLLRSRRRSAVAWFF